MGHGKPESDVSNTEKAYWTEIAVSKHPLAAKKMEEAVTTSDIATRRRNECGRIGPSTQAAYVHWMKLCVAGFDDRSSFRWKRHNFSKGTEQAHHGIRKSIESLYQRPALI